MLRILTYHRVMPLLPSPTLEARMISASPDVFDRQMRYVARHYRVVSPDQIVEALRMGRALPRNAVLITFDDACRDFSQFAWPILRRHRLTATLFVPTAYPDQPERSFWWDRLAVAFYRSSKPVLTASPLGTLRLDGERFRRSSLRQLQIYLKLMPHGEAMEQVDRICAELGQPQSDPAPVMGWNELRELARDGVTLGAHTRTHPVLTQLPLDLAQVEISGSREDLRREVGSAPSIFCYPFGSHDDAVVMAVRAAGFDLAVTCIRGQNDPAALDALRLRRTNVTRRTSPFVFRLRLLRAVSAVDAWRHRQRLEARRTAVLARSSESVPGPSGGGNER